MAMNRQLTSVLGSVWYTVITFWEFNTSGASRPFSTQVCFLILFELSSLSHTKAPSVFFLPLTRIYSLHFFSYQLPICSGSQDMRHVDLQHTALCPCFANAESFICCWEVVKFLVMYRPKSPLPHHLCCTFCTWVLFQIKIYLVTVLVTKYSGSRESFQRISFTKAKVFQCKGNAIMPSVS